MSCVPLLLATSIPPQLRGEALIDQKPASLQQRSLQSWRNAGCTPVSLHTSAELASHPNHEGCLQKLKISVLHVHQWPSLNQPSDKLPNLFAALTALVETYPSALLVITNADIVFSASSALPGTLRALAANQALVGRRCNVRAHDHAIEDFTAPEPTASDQRDIYGFDFFAFHAVSLRRVLPLIPQSLVFGRPWWDLYLPLALLAAGLELRDPGPDLFLHPHHEERWSAEQWYRHGQLADLRFPQLLHQQGCEAFARRWARQRRRAIRRWHGLTVLRHRFREQRRSLVRNGTLLPVHLSDVSDAINDLVDAELRRSSVPSP